MEKQTEWRRMRIEKRDKKWRRNGWGGGNWSRMEMLKNGRRGEGGEIENWRKGDIGREWEGVDGIKSIIFLSNIPMFFLIILIFISSIWGQNNIYVKKSDGCYRPFGYLHPSNCFDVNDTIIEICPCNKICPSTSPSSCGGLESIWFK